MTDSFTHDPSLTSQFIPLSGAQAPSSAGSSELANTQVVVVGGGTGAPVTIRCLQNLRCKVNAVVAMADDGGSTGELRKQAGVTPPGDVRKCLAAMAENPQDTFAKAFKYRFPFADNHALGNLLLSALEDASGSFPEAISICEKLLHTHGHVFPSTLTHVQLAAKTTYGHVVQGQASACHSNEPLARAWLYPTHNHEHITAYQPAVEALTNADVIVLGPGSLFTSIIANLVVPGIAEAIQASHAYVIYISSISDTQGETRGFTVKEQVQALLNHGMSGRINCVLADASRAGTHEVFPRNMRRIVLDAASKDYLHEQHISYVTYDFYNAEHPGWHSVSALQHALCQVIKHGLQTNAYAAKVRP